MRRGSTEAPSHPLHTSSFAGACAFTLANLEGGAREAPVVRRVGYVELLSSIKQQHTASAPRHTRISTQHARRMARRKTSANLAHRAAPARLGLEVLPSLIARRQRLADCRPSRIRPMRRCSRRQAAHRHAGKQ